MSKNDEKFLNSELEQYSIKNSNYSCFGIFIVNFIAVLIVLGLKGLFYVAKDYNSSFWNIIGINPYSIFRIEQKYDDALFVYGFEYGLTSGLKDLCESSGYVPITFINEVQNKYQKTFKNADILVKEYMKLNNMQDTADLTSKIYPVIYNEYLNSGLNKVEYCKAYDAAKDEILKESLRQLKTNKPNMYLD